jgi:hypothetical protein
LRLRTVRDHLEERFLHPLVLDRLCALVGPAMQEAAEHEGRAGPAFARLEKQIAPLAANPTGVGLDVPHWLRRLDAEVVRVRSGPPTGAGDEGRVYLAFADLQRQLNEWEKPLGA